MPSQNTVARTELTSEDRHALAACESISHIIIDQISSSDMKKEFLNVYGKVHYSRDAGQGRGAGKLQRDALCTRGRQAKAPFSNRNLRWHPLVISSKLREGFTQMNIQVDEKEKLLVFIPTDNPRNTFLPSQVHTLGKPYCLTSDSWSGHVDVLRSWTQDDWIPNWCAIPILEYSPIPLCLESFAILGLSIAVAFYDADLDPLYDNLGDFLQNEVGRLSRYYPDKSEELTKCPVCKASIKEYPAGLKPRERPDVWKPPWMKSKRNEGEDESIQLTHTITLNEKETNHNASSARYGHRWCNVAMTDHSLDEFYSFTEGIIGEK